MKPAGGLYVQIVKGLGREALSLCEQHGEPLKVFCLEDCALLCLLCDESKKHRAHLLLPVEEAAREYREKIQIKLQNLRLARTTVERSKRTQEKEMAKHLEVINEERAKIALGFQQLRLFLDEQESCLLAQLKELEKDQHKTCTRTLASFSFLSDLICDLEKDCQKPAGEFLQGLKETLCRCQQGEFLCSPEKLPNMEKNLSAISQQANLLMENFRKLKESLAAELQEEKAQRLNVVLETQTDWPQAFWPTLYGDTLRWDRKVSTVGVSLDPDTANPQLRLSLDRKTVTYHHRSRPLPDNPKRFDSELFVLGCESFRSGKHSWVVNVEQGQNWAVGVARASVERKACLSLNPEQGIWAVEHCWGQYQALTSPWTTLFLPRKPRRIKVHLDYDGGWVALSDAELEAPIFSFPAISFRQERIHPWLWVGHGSQLSL